MRTENPKDILERFGGWTKDPKLSSKDLGLDKRSKSYPRKIWGWTKDPKVNLERVWGWTKDPRVNLERVWGGQKIQKFLERLWGGRSQIDPDL